MIIIIYNYHEYHKDFLIFLVGSISKGPMRSSLKKPKNKDNASIDSTTSSKRVRIQLNQEQSSV